MAVTNAAGLKLAVTFLFPIVRVAISELFQSIRTLWNFLPLPPPLLLAGIVRGRKFEKGLPYTSLHTILSPSFPAVRVHIYCTLMCRQFNTTDATYIFAPRTRKLFFSALLSACAHFFLVAAASPHQRIARDFSSLRPLSHSPHP